MAEIVMYIHAQVSQPVVGKRLASSSFLEAELRQGGTHQWHEHVV